VRAYWARALRVRPCLCGHDAFDHSQVLAGEPCLDCGCPGFMYDTVRSPDSGGARGSVR
jgi:hypothetical protein